MNRTVLVIDDEPLIRRSLMRALASKGITCLEAADGRQGIATWRDHRPKVVLLDVLMPGLTGPEVLKEIETDLRQKSYVILISAYSGEYDLESAKLLGADHFYSKPFDDIFQIVSFVESVLQSE